jgi:hypothetical protein
LSALQHLRDAKVREEQAKRRWQGNDDKRERAKLNYERLALAALDALLAGGLEISQHHYDPDPVKGPMGIVGPFETPEAAITAAFHACRSASSPSRPLPPLR